MADYCTLEELKAELKITDTADDELLQLAISAASDQIDSHCGVAPGGLGPASSATARTFCPDHSTLCYVDPIATTTGLVVKVDTNDDGTYETTLALTDYVLRPSNALAYGEPYTELHLVSSASAFFPNLYPREAVQVTATWGLPAVPEAVEKACRVQATQLYKAKDTAFGVAGFAEFGVLRVQARMNPIAAALLAGYRKPAIG